MTHHLTPEETATLARRLEAAHDLKPHPIRDPLMLEILCARAHTGKTPHAAAALLAEGILNNRPFHHLNEATALAAMEATLALNGLKLACSAAALNRALTDWRTTDRANAPTIETWLKLASEAT